GAMGQAIPERLFAAPAGTSGNFGLGGYDPEENRHYIMYLFSGGGYGGLWQTGGVTHGRSSGGVPSGRCPPVIHSATRSTTNGPGTTPLPTPCGSYTRRIPTISIYVLSSPKRSSTVHPGACGTCGPASPRPAPARSRRARCSSPPSAICRRR